MLFKIKCFFNYSTSQAGSSCEILRAVTEESEKNDLVTYLKVFLIGCLFTFFYISICRDMIPSCGSCKQTKILLNCQILSYISIAILMEIYMLIIGGGKFNVSCAVSWCKLPDYSRSHVTWCKQKKLLNICCLYSLADLLYHVAWCKQKKTA